MGLFNKDLDSTMPYLKVVQGIPGMTSGQTAKLYLYKDKLTINEKQTIPLSRIKEATTFTQKEIETKDKSVVGRALIGTALLGPIGTIVGGMSGIGSKSKSKNLTYLSIHYIDKDGVDQTAVFNYDGKFALMGFANVLNKKIGANIKANNEPFEI